jgi:hypothetical protein
MLKQIVRERKRERERKASKRSLLTDEQSLRRKERKKMRE